MTGWAERRAEHRAAREAEAERQAEAVQAAYETGDWRRRTEMPDTRNVFGRAADAAVQRELNLFRGYALLGLALMVALVMGGIAALLVLVVNHL